LTKVTTKPVLSEFDIELALGSLEKDPKGVSLCWLEAREVRRDKGGLPSNVFLDDMLIYSDAWKKVRENGYVPLWARELEAYPKKNGVFEDGKDLEDPYPDKEGRTWRLPRKYIPRESRESKGVGLFILPSSYLEITKWEVVIIPEKVTMLYPFIQSRTGGGKVDMETRVPLAVPYTGLHADHVRYGTRSKEAGIKPIFRYLTEDYTYRRCVDSYDHDVLPHLSPAFIPPRDPRHW
jgi:hypothetical protein